MLQPLFLRSLELNIDVDAVYLYRQATRKIYKNTVMQLKYGALENFRDTVYQRYCLHCQFAFIHGKDRGTGVNYPKLGQL